MHQRVATLVAIVTVSAALTIAGQLLSAGWLVWVFKPLATAALVVAAWSGGPGAYPRSITLGLALSLAGDVLLIPEGLFVFGLVAFLLAHLAYLFAFTRAARLAARWLPFVVVAAIAVAIVAKLWGGLPPALRVAVLAYVAVLGAMCAQAITVALVTGTPRARLAALGGVLFLVSDALLAINRFHTPLALAPLLVLGTYYPAQLLIALSAAPHRGSRSR